MGNKILKHLSIFFILFLISLQAYTQNILFNKIYPKPNGIDLEAVAAYQLPSGNYFVIARHDNGSYFARMDSFGNKIWESINNDRMVPHYSIKRKNGNFLISGDSCCSYPLRVFVKEIDSTGNTIWDKQLGTQHEAVEWAISSKLKEYSDSKIKLITTDHNPLFINLPSLTNQHKSYFYTFDSIGNALDTTVLIGSYSDFTNSDDSGFVLTGAYPVFDRVTPSNDTLWSYELVITKLNDIGDSIWAKKYGQNRYLSGLFGQGPWFGQSIIRTESGYLIGGNTRPPFEAGTEPGFLDYFDFNGNPINNFGSFQFPFLFPFEKKTSSFLKRTSNNGFFYGTSTSYCDNPGDCFYAGAYSYFMKYDSTFNQEWADSGSVSWFGTKSISETKNGGYIAVGNTSQYNYLPPWDIGRLNLWNYDSLGNSISSLNHSLGEKQNISVFPNPALDQLNFAFSSAMFHSANVDVYSLQGDLLYSTSLNEEGYSIDISILSPGIYLYKIQSGKHNSVGKFIKQ